MDIMEHAIQLGMAVAESKELLAMHEAEDKLEQDQDAVAILQELEAKRAAMGQLLMQEGVAKEKVEALSQEIDALEKKALENETIAAVKKAQNDFAGVMSKINAVLKYYIMGESEETDGCTGNCAGCSSCQ